MAAKGCRRSGAMHLGNKLELPVQAFGKPRSNEELNLTGALPIALKRSTLLIALVAGLVGTTRTAFITN